MSAQYLQTVLIWPGNDKFRKAILYSVHRPPCLASSSSSNGAPCGPVKQQQYTTHPFNSPLSRTTQVSQYQKGKTNLDFTEGRDSEWQWHQLGYMQVCTSLQTDNHASTPPLLCFLQAGCPSCRPANSVKALKAQNNTACANMYKC